MDPQVRVKDIISKFCIDGDMDKTISFKDIFDECLDKYQKQDFIEENIVTLINTINDSSFRENIIKNLIVDNCTFQQVLELLDEDDLKEWAKEAFDLEEIEL